MVETANLQSSFESCTARVKHQMNLVLKLTALIGEDLNQEEYYCSRHSLSNIPSCCSSSTPFHGESLPLNRVENTGTYEQFHIDMSLKTVHEVWQEYCVGTPTRPSVIEVNGEHGNYEFASSPSERRISIIRGRLIEALVHEMRYGRELGEVLQVAETRLQEECGGDFTKLLKYYEANQPSTNSLNK